MSRPPARKSSLSNLNPIQASPAAEMPNGHRDAAPKKTTKDQKRVTFQIDTEILEYARGAYTQDLANGEATTWSAWVENALKLATEHSNKKHNTPAKPIPTGVLPRGVLPGTTRNQN